MGGKNTHSKGVGKATRKPRGLKSTEKASSKSGSSMISVKAKKRQHSTYSSFWFVVIAGFGAAMAFFFSKPVLFPIAPLQRNTTDDPHSSFPKDPALSSRPPQKVLHRFAETARAARNNPTSTEAAQLATQSALLEGLIRDTYQWNVQTLRRQAQAAGATLPQQDRVDEEYGMRYFLQHLEVNVILLSRVLLQGGVPYARQLEHECHANSTALSQALMHHPRRLPRSLVANVLARCIGKDRVLVDYWPTVQHRDDKYWTLWHLLAHFGDPMLLAAVEQHHRIPTNLRGSVAEVAANRGFTELAHTILGTELEATISKDVCPPHCPTITYKVSSRLMDDNGGWGGTRSESEILQTNCSIPVLNHVPSVAEFYSQFVLPERPVLVRGGATNVSKLRQLLQFQSFRRDFGAMPFSVGNVPYQDSATMPLNEYVRDTLDKTDSSQEALYLFESLPYGHPLRSQLEKSGSFPSWLLPLQLEESEGQVQLAIGPMGSGAPPHYHKAAINILVYGRKRWAFLRRTEYSSMPAADWWREERKKGHHGQDDWLECEQFPGDVVFVPDFWSHATYNLAPTVAVATEFVTPRMDFDMVL